MERPLTEPGFRICGAKGFHIMFENGWTVSVQFGRGNYSGNYDLDVDYDDPVSPSPTAEVAVFRGEEWLTLSESGGEVAGYLGPAEVLAIMDRVAAMPAKTEAA